MPSFEEYKKKAMKKYKEALDSGLVDEDAKPINDLINSLDNYYTTSSCAGRVTIDGFKNNENKKEHEWILKEHDLIDSSGLKKTFKEYKTIYMKTDSFIFHIGCKTIKDAEKLLECSRKVGLKRSGIVEIKKRIVVEIIGLDEIDIPLKFEGEVLFNSDKINVVVELINSKLKKNKERREKLLNVLIDEFNGSSATK